MLIKCVEVKNFDVWRKDYKTVYTTRTKNEETLLTSLVFSKRSKYEVKIGVDAYDEEEPKVSINLSISFEVGL